MGRKRSNLTDILYVRVKPGNRRKLLRHVESLRRRKKKGVSASAVVDKLLERYIYAGNL